MLVVCYVAEALAILGYLLAAILYPQRLIRPQSRSTAYAHWALILAAGLQGIGLLAHAGRAGGQVVLGQSANVAYVLVLLIVIGLLFVETKLERPTLGAFLAPIVFLLVILTMFESRSQMPATQQPWLIMHIGLSLIAYACFGVAFCMGMAYLVKDGLLKRKQMDRLPLLPPLHVSEHAAHVAVAIGFPVFTLGLGIAAAQLVAAGLKADLKIGVSLTVWFLYGAYLFLHDGSRWRGRKLHFLLVLNFILVLVNFVLARHPLQLIESVLH